jgi:ubiquinone/menaquinone biosynthesis C-methylase UbiE
MNGDYHFRTPHVLQMLGWLGVVVTIASLIWALVSPSGYGVIGVVVGVLLILPVVIVRVVIRSLMKRRFRVRDGMVDHAGLHGDEQILDVGVGSGITLFGLVSRLTTGKGIGIDIYDPNAGGGNADIFWKNAHQEGLTDRVDLKNMDARQMSFADQSFDVVVSTFAFHHMGNQESRRKAAQEIVRVLKPGGKVLVYDVSHILGELEQTMRDAGMRVHMHGGHFAMVMGEKAA